MRAEYKYIICGDQFRYLELSINTIVLFHYFSTTFPLRSLATSTVYFGPQSPNANSSKTSRPQVIASAALHDSGDELQKRLYDMIPITNTTIPRLKALRTSVDTSLDGQRLPFSPPYIDLTFHRLFFLLRELDHVTVYATANDCYDASRISCFSDVLWVQKSKQHTPGQVD